MLVVRTKMSEVEEHATDTDSEYATSEPPAKKMKVEQSSSENGFLANLFCMSTAAAVQDELDSYLISIDSGSDLLNYWRGKEDIWPKLSMCAKCVLSTPATSTSSERLFSLAGRTLDDRRSQLNREIVNRLLFLHGLPDVSKQ